MAERHSKRQASQKAAARIKAMSASKPKLPNGMLAKKANHTKRVAIDAERLSWAIRQSDDPIRSFNKWEESKKELLMEHLLLNHRKFFYGVNSADNQLPCADRALMRGLKLFNQDAADVPSNETPKREHDDETIHGEPRWPPSVSITGNCSRPVSIDNAGCVDLLHDPYCLRAHFTTQWGVLKDQDNDPPQLGPVMWSDQNWYLEVEGKHPGLRVNISNPQVAPLGERLLDLAQLISSPLLLYRIVVNFGAPPSTNTDGYKSGWEFIIRNRDDPKCSLRISDHKGWAQAIFYGGRKASTEALQLFDWLTGDNCPHSYDYTPCGASA